MKLIDKLQELTKKHDKLLVSNASKDELADVVMQITKLQDEIVKELLADDIRTEN